MHKLWIINQYALPKGAAGITRHGDLAYVLAQKGFDVTVFASSYDNFTRAGELQSQSSQVSYHEGVRFVWIKTPAYQGNDGKRVKNMLSFFFSLLRASSLKQYGVPDVILGSSPHLLSALAGSILAWRYRKPFVLELRDVWPEDLVALDALKENSLTYRILKKLSNHLNWRAKHIITVPTKLHQHLQALLPGKDITHIPNGVFLTEQPDVALPDSLQQLFEREAGRFKLVYMGAHGVANNLGNVLDTAVYLRDNKPALDDKLAFIFVGGGQERDRLMALAKQQGLERVHFHLPVAKACVPVVTAQADALLVHLSDADTFSAFGRSPNKLYDYLAAQKPVLFSTLDQETILSRERAGITFAPGQPAAFAQALEDLLSLPASERDAMAMRGRQAVEQQHDLWGLGGQLAEVLQAVIGSSAHADSKVVLSKTQ